MIKLTKEEVGELISSLQKLPFEGVAQAILFLDNKLRQAEEAEKTKK